MRGIAVLFAVFLASTVAFDLKTFDQKSELSANDQRIITDAIAAAINEIAKAIRDAGLDPWHVPYFGGSYSFPVEEIFEANAYVQDLRSQGLSNIVINNLSLNVITTRLSFDIVMPSISFSVGDSAANAIVFNDFDLNGSASGSVTVRRIRVNGSVRVNIGIISGISIRDLSLNFSLDGINSDVAVNIFGRDISDYLNTFIGTTIPNSLENSRDSINEFLVYIIMLVMDQIL